MADEMLPPEFTAYMKGFERRLDARFDGIHEELASLKTDVSTLKTDVRTLKTDVSALKTDVSVLKTKVSSLEIADGGLAAAMAALKSDVADLRQTMLIQFEDVRRDIRLSFEAVETLHETTDRGFADMRTVHANQTSLLEAVVRHVRRRIDTVEQASRGRKSRSR